MAEPLRFGSISAAGAAGIDSPALVQCRGGASSMSLDGFRSKSGQVLVLDDDPGVRQTMSTVLSRAGYEVVCCATISSLLSLARERIPSCIVLDLVLRDASGLEALRLLTKECCPAPVVMISGHGDISIAVDAMKHGAADFLQKPFRGPEIIECVKAAIDATCARSRDPELNLYFPGSMPLTQRERDVLTCVVSGQSSKDAARLLQLSPRTVEGHRANIMRKLGARNLADLARMMMSNARAPAGGGSVDFE